MPTQPQLPVEEAYKNAVYELELSEPLLQNHELVILNPSILNPEADGDNHLAFRLVVEQQNPPDSLTVFVDALAIEQFLVGQLNAYFE